MSLYVSAHSISLFSLSLVRDEILFWISFILLSWLFKSFWTSSFLCVSASISPFRFWNLFNLASRSRLSRLALFVSNDSFSISRFCDFVLFSSKFLVAISISFLDYLNFGERLPRQLTQLDSFRLFYKAWFHCNYYR